MNTLLTMYDDFIIYRHVGVYILNTKTSGFNVTEINQSSYILSIITSIDRIVVSVYKLKFLSENSMSKNEPGC